MSESAYVPTGWRITGPDAEQIAQRVAAAAEERLDAGDAAEALYAVQCTSAPVVGGRPTVERILDAVTEEIRRTWPDCPRLVRDAPAHRPPSRFGGLRYDVEDHPGREWLGEVVWRSVHPVVAGAAITTHLLVEERPSFTRFTVRVTPDAGAASVRGYVGAGQSQPGFLEALRRDVPLTWLGGPLGQHAIRRGEVEDFVRSVLESPTRDHPVAVLAPLTDGTFVVDPEELMIQLLGRARLYVIHDHKLTFELSDTVGDRRMSCYWGAVRCYLPEWSRYDDPIDHPLLVADRLTDPIMRATWLGEIGMWMAAQVGMPPGIEERREKARAEGTKARRRAGDTSSERPGRGKAAAIVAIPVSSPPAPDAAPAEPEQRPAAPAPAAPDPTPLLHTLIDDVRGLAAAVRGLADAVEQLKTISAVRSAGTTAIERRLGRLEDLLETYFPRVDPLLVTSDGAAESGAAENGDGSVTVSDVVLAAAEAHSDTLLFLDAAHTSAADSPYEDPERVRAILDAMARVARRRGDGSLGVSLREAFGELGIDYRPGISRNTSARMREQYRFTHPSGVVIEAEEHIALGGTYDPRRCLRVYFTSRMPNESRFVIGHVGRHFEVASTT